MSRSISVIGSGHLGGALIRGLIKNGYAKESITASNRNADKLTRLVNDLGICPALSNVKAVEKADVLILAVKPQFMQEVCLEIAASVQQKRPLVISLAGVTEIARIAQWLGEDDLEIVRVMTNTPMEFGKGISALYANNHLSAERKKEVESIFKAVGTQFWVDKEQLLDPLTAAIGSAPAYVLLCMEALEKAAVSQGIPQDIAKKVAFDVFAGTAVLAEHSGRSFAELRAGVTTPNGITEHSLKQLSIEQFFEMFKNVYQAAGERINQIATDSNKS